MAKRCFYGVFLCVLWLEVSTAWGAARVRPVTWAQPVIGTSLKNWYRVDDKVFRSEQPNRAEMKILEGTGVRCVLNLRAHHSDTDEAKDTGLKLNRVKMRAGSIDIHEIVRALRMIQESEGPVLVHCWHGSDRTGAVVAAYRIVFQGWSPESAVDELLHGGYGFHSQYDNIPRLILETEWEAIRQRILPAEVVDQR